MSVEATFRRVEDGEPVLCHVCVADFASYERTRSYVVETLTLSSGEVRTFRYCDEHPPAGWLTETSECPSCGAEVRENEEHEHAEVGA